MKDSTKTLVGAGARYVGLFCIPVLVLTLVFKDHPVVQNSIVGGALSVGGLGCLFTALALWRSEPFAYLWFHKGKRGGSPEEASDFEHGVERVRSVVAPLFLLAGTAAFCVACLFFRRALHPF